MTLEKRMKRAIKSNDIRIIHEVFEEIYVTYGKLVYFKIMQYVSNKLDVEELTQDVFVSFYNNLKCTDILDIKYYLVASAKNKAVDFIKKKKVVLQSDDRVIFETEDIVDNYMEYDDIIEIMKCFLNEFEIEIIIKHIIDDLSFKQLSIQYKKPLNTIISIYHRALKKFKKERDKNEREK